MLSDTQNKNFRNIFQMFSSMRAIVLSVCLAGLVRWLPRTAYGQEPRIINAGANGLSEIPPPAPLSPLNGGGGRANGAPRLLPGGDLEGFALAENSAPGTKVYTLRYEYIQ